MPTFRPALRGLRCATVFSTIAALAALRCGEFKRVSLSASRSTLDDGPAPAAVQRYYQ